MQKRRRFAKHLSEDVPRSELTREIEGAFLSMTDYQVASWEEAATTGWHGSVYAEAHRFVRDQRLALHVHTTNRDKGLAIRSELLPDIANALYHADVAPGGVLPDVLPRSDTAQRSWGYRWCKRVRGFMGAFVSRPEGLSIELVRQKVRCPITRRVILRARHD